MEVVETEPPMVHDAFTVATPDSASDTCAAIFERHDVPPGHEIPNPSSSQTCPDDAACPVMLGGPCLAEETLEELALSVSCQQSAGLVRVVVPPREPAPQS